MCASEPMPSHLPLDPPSPPSSPLPRVSVTLGVGVWARAAGGEKESECGAALRSWRTAVHLWLPKREELRKTGTKAHQLRP